MKQLTEITDFLEYLAEAIIIVNSSSEIIFANQACLNLFGYQRKQMLQQRLEDLMHHVHASHHPKLVRNYIQNKSPAKEMQSRTTFTCIEADGSEFHARISIAAIEMAGSIYGVATIQDFTPIRDEMATLELHSYIDSLTNLYNRYYLEMISQKESRIMQQWTKIAVLYLDLNKFKPVNDKYGHGTGDRVLIEIAQCLNNNLRHDDLIFRLGGDEFLLLCNMTDVDRPRKQINKIAQMVVKQISRSIIIDDISIQVGASVGAAIYPDDGSTLDEVIDLADKAMYEAKQRRTSVHFVD